MKAEITYSRNRRDRDDWTIWELSPTPGFFDPAGPKVTCRAAYDADGLYLRAEVTAPWGSDGERSWRYGDGFQVTVSPEPTGEETTRFTTLGFSLTGGQPRAVIVNRNGTWLLSPAPPGTALVARPDPAGGATYDMTIPWPLVPPLSGVLDGALGLNVTYIGLLPPGSAPAAGTRTVLQLVSDPDYDAEGRDGRRVKRISLEEGRLKSPVVRARLTRTFGADDDATALEVGVLTAKSGRAEFLAEVFPAEDPRPGEDPAPSRRVSRSVASCQLYQGRNRFRHDFRAANLKGGRYLLSLDVSVNGRPQGHADLPFYKLRLEELAALRERYDRAVTRAGGRLHRVLPSMAIRFQWLDELRTRLDPAHDPRPLRETYDEVGRMVAALEAGRDPFSGSAGYQRRAFRSKIDGSLQPYSVHIPSAAAENPAGRHPLLVMLHGSGVDETAAARSPGLVRELDARGWLLCAPLGRDLSGWYLGDSGRDIFEAIDAARATLPVDDRAIFLAGFSMGGYGVWRHGPLNRQNFAGLAVLSGRTQNPFGPAGGAGAGGPDPDDPSRYLDKTVGLPVFVAHGSDDAAVPVGSTREFVGRLREAGAWVVYHEYAGAGHGDYDAWTELFEWMEKVRRGEAAGDTPQPQAPEPR